MRRLAIQLLGDSDTMVGVPLHRPPAFRGVASGAQGNTIHVGTDADSTPSWEQGQFAYSADHQPDTFYVTVEGGPLAGVYFVVLDNGENTLIVDDAGYDLATAVSNGAQIRVIPFWTLGTLFAEGHGVHASSNHFTRNTTVMLFDPDRAGINHSADAIYYYLDGPDAGWRKIGDGPDAIHDDAILVPDSYFVVRHNLAAATELRVVGSVPMWTSLTPVNVLAAGQAQDNTLNLPAPVEITLRETNLVESGAFEGSDNHIERRDLLLVFENDTPGKNRAASRIYYYFTGANPGWRLIGGGDPAVALDDDPAHALKPGQGFVIRKAAQPAPTTVGWQFSPPYAAN